MVLEKYAQTSKRFDYEIPATHEFASLHDLFNQHGADKVHLIKAMFINKKSRYGDSPILVTENELVNAPNHLTETVKAMIADGELVDAVNANRIGFKIYTYKTKKYNGTFYGIQWEELKGTE